MTKAERLRALKEKLEYYEDKGVINKLERVDACILLDQFVYLFEFKKKRKNTGGRWKKGYYSVLGWMIFASGIKRDLRVNDTLGYKFFGEFAKRGKFKTLTSTLKRVKGAKTLITNVDHTGNFEDVLQYCDPKYGCVSVEYYNLAVQICLVLNDWDEGHC